MRTSQALFATLAVILIFGSHFGEAATYHRLPVAYIPYPINAWKDDPNSSRNGTTIRYDGVNLTNTRWAYDGHRGTDFGVPYGTAVYVSAKGTVYLVHTSCAPNGGYLGNPCGYGFGNFVSIKHADRMVSVDAHLSSVAVGSGFLDCITGPGGNLLGHSGNSGDSSGPHLHFELRINNLLAASTSYEPFAGVKSTQPFEYWYRYALITDPVRTSRKIHYPATTCAP